jgi:hypothetical protein
MQDNFSKYTKRMTMLLNELKGKPLLNRNKLRDIPRSGIYVFYEGGKPIYVGRSNRLKERIQEHGRPSSDHYSATLAFRMADVAMGQDKKIPQSVATRGEKEKAPGFDRAFFEARKRVAEMKIRVIGIEDQIEQSLFEIYAHLALKTKYNDFGTH